MFTSFEQVQLDLDLKKAGTQMLLSLDYETAEFRVIKNLMEQYDADIQDEEGEEGEEGEKCESPITKAKRAKRDDIVKYFYAAIATRKFIALNFETATLEEVTSLIDQKACVNGDVDYREGTRLRPTKSPLMHAAKAGRADIIAILLMAKASLTVSGNHWTAFSIAYNEFIRPKYYVGIGSSEELNKTALNRQKCLDLLIDAGYDYLLEQAKQYRGDRRRLENEISSLAGDFRTENPEICSEQLTVILNRRILEPVLKRYAEMEKPGVAMDVAPASAPALEPATASSASFATTAASVSTHPSISASSSMNYSTRFSGFDTQYALFLEAYAALAACAAADAAMVPAAASASTASASSSSSLSNSVGSPSSASEGAEESSTSAAHTKKRPRVRDDEENELEEQDDSQSETENLSNETPAKKQNTRTSPKR